MFFRTSDECLKIANLSGLSFDVDKQEILANGESWPSVVMSLRDHDFNRTYFIARMLVKLLVHDTQTMLWITEFGIWPSSENRHLYYLVRRTYGDFRAICEAPGHLFLKHEQEDLITFVQLAILSKWGGYVFGLNNENILALSHDKYATILSKNDANNIAVEINKYGFYCENIPVSV